MYKRGLSRLVPKWLGEREDLTSVGGAMSRDPKNWKDSPREIFDNEKKSIVAAVVEILVHIVMTTHVYQFCGKYFLQQNGGPIGLRSTASLASLIMKILGLPMVEVVETRGD